MSSSRIGRLAENKAIRTWKVDQRSTCHHGLPYATLILLVVASSIHIVFNAMQNLYVGGVVAMRGNIETTVACARYVLPFAQSSFSSSTLCFLFSFFHLVYGFHFWLRTPFLILFMYSPFQFFFLSYRHVFVSLLHFLFSSCTFHSFISFPLTIPNFSFLFFLLITF